MIKLPSLNEQVAVVDACDHGIRPSTIMGYGDDWEAPTGEEIKTILKLAELSGSQAGLLVGVNSRTIRKWTGEEREIPYAAWSLLVDAAGCGQIWKE